MLDGVTACVEGRLALKVNQDKSSITTATNAALLGFGFYFLAGGRVRVRVTRKALVRCKQRVRSLTGRSWGVSMSHRLEKLNRFIAGWCAYFGFADNFSVFEELDEWMRRRLRACYWKQWKRWNTRRRNLLELGMSERDAALWALSSKGYWRIAGSFVLQRARPNSHWHDLGLQGFTDHWQRRQAA